MSLPSEDVGLLYLKIRALCSPPFPTHSPSFSCGQEKPFSSVRTPVCQYEQAAVGRQRARGDPQNDEGKIIQETAHSWSQTQEHSKSPKQGLARGRSW